MIKLTISQSPERRAYLAVVDFPSIGILYPCQPDQLLYYHDGRPAALPYEYPDSE